jgi:hypothetical protein
MTASVYQFPVSSLRRPTAPVDATSAALVFPAAARQVEDESGEPFTPNRTEINAAHQYALGAIDLVTFVQIIGVDLDQRAAQVLCAYTRGAQ